MKHYQMSVMDITTVGAARHNRAVKESFYNLDSRFSLVFTGKRSVTEQVISIRSSLERLRKN
jgi:hypothetical protein